MSFINLAARMAPFSTGHYQYLVCAVLVKGSKILSIGMNKNKTHPIMGNLKHLHAECDAILQVKDSRKIVGSKIYVVRVNVNGKIGMARPCPICLSTLKEYGVAEMSYTDRAGNIILEKVN